MRLKKVFVVGLSLFLSNPTEAAWTLIQHVCNASCGNSSTCNITVSATGSGNLIVAKMINDSGTNTSISSVSGGGTYTHCSNCYGGTNVDVDASYTTNSTAGATTITINLGIAANGWRACMDEVSSSLGQITLDGGAAPSCHGVVATAAPISCALTLAGANDIISTAHTWSGALTNVNSPYAGFDAPNGNGAASNVNTGAGTGAVWVPTTNGIGKNFSIAFQEAALTKSVNIKGGRVSITGGIVSVGPSQVTVVSAGKTGQCMGALCGLTYSQ